MAQGEDVSNIPSTTVEKPQLSKIELKLRRKLKLIVGQLSDGSGIKFLKNRAQNEMKKNRRKLGVKRPVPADGIADPKEEYKDPQDQEQPKKREDKTQTKQ